MRYELGFIPSGVAGIRETLRAMSHIVKAFKKSPPIRELALHLVNQCPAKDMRCEAYQVHRFVRDDIRYVRDIRGVETLQTPVQTLRLGQGDCDDKSTLTAALLETLGHRTRFVAIATQEADRYSHVFPQVQLGPHWITLETTEPWPMGRTPRRIVSKLMQHN